MRGALLCARLMTRARRVEEVESEQVLFETGGKAIVDMSE